MSYIVATLAVIFLFGLTVFVHELGHFIVARWCGMIVETFSIGFGPAIWKKTVRGVTYKIGWIPFGGYVALPQMDPTGGEKKDDDKQDPSAPAKKPVPPIEPWKKILVAMAGAVGNVLLAILIAYIIYWADKPKALQQPRTPTVGYIETNGVAYAAGLREGDTVVSVNGNKVQSWEDFLTEGALTDRASVKVRGVDGGERELSIPTEIRHGMRGFWGVSRSSVIMVVNVRKGTPAEAAGVKAGDRILEFDGKSVYSREQFIDLVQTRGDVTTPLILERDGKRLELTVAPKLDKDMGRVLIGVEFNPIDLHLRPWDQMYGWSAPVFRVLKALVTPKESGYVAKSLQGPVGIFENFWKAAFIHFLFALWVAGMLNVNLAILNLLPIPVLDGGHIFFSLAEWIRGRRLNEKFVSVTHTIFAFLLISLFVWLTIRDSFKHVKFGGSKTAPTNAVPAAATNAPAAVPSP